MKIFIPTPLRGFTGKQDAVEVSGATVHDVLEGLTTRYPDLRKHLFTEEGKLRSFVNVYLNDEDIRYLELKERTVVSDSDSLSIIPSIAGGTCRPGRCACGGTGRTGVQRLRRVLWGSLPLVAHFEGGGGARKLQILRFAQNDE